MAKGSIAKQEVLDKIKEVFPNAFEYGKEFRIPIEENGETVQIKINLTCAKVNVECGGTSSVAASETDTPVEKVEVTEEERQNVQKLMEGLGL